ncbi:MAG TPA: hypothetical protein VLL25_16525 [Acidimicrobiales bacterium]|nr:hypothetical protein [Acidimicrobiales bacterium]
MSRTDDSAAYAANWRVVLAFDATLGVAVSVAGLVIALAASVIVGMLVVAVGAAYCALLGARARRWIRLRREAGL